MDDALADFAVGFGADYVKAGVFGKEDPQNLVFLANQRPNLFISIILSRSPFNQIPYFYLIKINTIFRAFIIFRTGSQPFKRLQLGNRLQTRTHCISLNKLESSRFI